MNASQLREWVVSCGMLTTNVFGTSFLHETLCFSLDWIFSRKVWNLLEDISINSDFNRDRKKNLISHRGSIKIPFEDFTNMCDMFSCDCGPWFAHGRKFTRPAPFKADTGWVWWLNSITVTGFGLRRYINYVSPFLCKMDGYYRQAILWFHTPVLTCPYADSCSTLNHWKQQPA